MLVGTAFAADSTKVYNINGTIITFGEDSGPVQTRALRSRDFVDATITTSSSFRVSDNCTPSNGNNFKLYVINLGSTNIRIEVEIVKDGIPVQDESILKGYSGPYVCSAENENGLELSFELVVSPAVPGEEITFEVYAGQY